MTTSQDATSGTAAFPVVRQVVLDCPHPRTLAEFYRELLGYSYRPGDEPPPAGEDDPLGEDWLVLLPPADDPEGGRGMAFQHADGYVRPDWRPVKEPPPPGRQQQMLHLDMTVPDLAALGHQRDRAVGLGATVLFDRSADEEEPLYVFADPDGHPFCIFVG
jgi:catechol 2,3-dioxygenase-like lactoylglutathione lyase family enzyme